MAKIYNDNANQKKDGVVILMSGKLRASNKEDHFIMTKESIHLRT